MTGVQTCALPISTPLESALVTTPVPGLRVILAGDSPPNPSELLGSSRLSELVKYLAADHEAFVALHLMLNLIFSFLLNLQATHVELKQSE